MAGHVHAELMAQYAEDAKRTECPWLNWQSRKKPPWGSGTWGNLPGNPSWSTDCEYRRKPQPVEKYHLTFDDGSMSRCYTGLDDPELIRRFNQATVRSKMVKITYLDGEPVSIERVK